MQVFQVRIKLFLFKDISTKLISQKLAAFIDQELVSNSEFKEFHNARIYKMYSFDQLYPYEPDKIYKKNQIYTLTIRTVKPELADFFANRLIHTYTEYLKGLTGELRIIPKKHLQKVYNLTPIIVKPEDGGYWKQSMSLQTYEQLLFSNLVKKWNEYHNNKMDENFQFYTVIELKNKKPLPFSYKGMTMLGDKLCLHIADNTPAQELAYFSLGVGIGTMNARGAGFMNYRYM